MKISFIGGGNMAQALISGLQKHAFTMQNIHVIELDDNKRQQLQQAFGVQASADLANIATSDVIVLAVKPQQLKSQQVKPHSKTQRMPIPSNILHQVNLRDRRQCTHINPSGVRCNQRRWIEVEK